MGKEKLSEGPAQTAHARVSVAVMWERLEALEAVADDPARVKKWVKAVWLELGKCQAVV